MPLDGLRVLSLESRRAAEIAELIRRHGGEPISAPSMREVPLGENAAAAEFAARLVAGEIDVAIFLTGVGTRFLAESLGERLPRERLGAELSHIVTMARGPKPRAVLAELGVQPTVSVPEPNTWRELLTAIDARAEEKPLRGARVAVQEYGVSNRELIDALGERGASVTRVPVYRWALPEDLEPLKNAVRAIARGEVDVIMFTTGVQVVHLWQIVGEMQIEADVRRELARTMVASIGPSTSEELRRHGLSADLEPSQPKIGFLVREEAEQSASVLRAKRLS